MSTSENATPTPSEPKEDDVDFLTLFGRDKKSRMYQLPPEFKEIHTLVEFDAFLTWVINIRGMSDIWLSEGQFPFIRVRGQIIPMDDIMPITEADFFAFAKHITKSEDLSKIKGSVDAAYSALDIRRGVKMRFRTNTYKTKGLWRICARAIPTVIPKYEELGVPQGCADWFAQVREGLVLVTGPTGSGKSTTIASLISHRAARRAEHVLTLEDPIEFLFPDDTSRFSQREMNEDFPNFADAMRAGLRQNPNTIYVGETRDPETAEIALHASETGHLVVTTLHTRRAHQAINRFALMFGPAMREEILETLATSIKTVICQRLVPSADGGRVALLEIIHNKLGKGIAPLIANDKIEMIASTVQSGGDPDSFLFVQHAERLYQSGRIKTEDYKEICTSLEIKPKDKKA